tara:strand:- start:1554 stop:2123 length:570 start_codon:yes stop_codon:yes gene_type:complete
MVTASERIALAKQKNLYFNTRNHRSHDSDVIMSRRKFKIANSDAPSTDSVIQTNLAEESIVDLYTLISGSIYPHATKKIVSYYKDNQSVYGSYIELVNKNNKQHLKLVRKTVENSPHTIKILGSNQRTFKQKNEDVSEVSISNQTLNYIDDQVSIDLLENTPSIFKYYRIVVTSIHSGTFMELSSASLV